MLTGLDIYVTENIKFGQNHVEISCILNMDMINFAERLPLDRKIGKKFKIGLIILEDMTSLIHKTKSNHSYIFIITTFKGKT